MALVVPVNHVVKLRTLVSEGVSRYVQNVYSDFDFYFCSHSNKWLLWSPIADSALSFHLDIKISHVNYFSRLVTNFKAVISSNR